MSTELIRPSSLPKLAHCRCYVSQSGTSEAAARGTRIDAIIREWWVKKERVAPADETQEDADAIAYGIKALMLLSCGCSVETREEELQAIVPVVNVKPGTMDALCVEGGWLADFKTGQVRDYDAQMAAYALACMDAYFADEWTSHLLFVDQQLTVSHRWTREEAEQLVLSIVNAPKVPTPFENCSWCGAFETCEAVRAATTEVTPALPKLTADAKGKGFLPPSMEGMLADHAAAHEFLSKLAIVNDWADMLKRKLRDQLETTESDYFKKVVVAGNKKVNPLSLAKYGMELGYDRMLKICPQVPLSKVQEIWSEVFGDKPVPEDIIVTSGGSVQLRLKTIKKSLTNNK